MEVGGARGVVVPLPLGDMPSGLMGGGKKLLASLLGLTLKGGLQRIVGVTSVGVASCWGAVAACSSVVRNLVTNSENTGATVGESRSETEIENNRPSN